MLTMIIFAIVIIAIVVTAIYYTNATPVYSKESVEEKYYEILYLYLKLKERKTVFYIRKKYDGYQIVVPFSDGEITVNEYGYSYGSVMDLLEVVDEKGNVKGFLNVEQALHIIDGKLEVME